MSLTTQDKVIIIIKSFSPSKYTGPNSIPVKILKILIHDISIPIMKIVNRSFETGVFPFLLYSTRFQK